MIDKNIFIANLSAYTSPVITEVKHKDWVQYGVDNDYFNYLIDLYINSTSNNAIINGVTNMIYGRGISALDASRRPEQYAQMITLFKKKDLRKFAKDFKILGMACFQVVYEKGKVKQVHHFPMETLRAEKCNDEGEIEAWYYSNDWANIKPTEKPERIPAFGYGNKKGVELYVLSPYTPGHYYYNPCDYAGALPYAKLENEIGDYLINDCINGFSGTKVVNFNNGVPDPEKMMQVKSDVLNKLTGARGEKVIVAFNQNQESKTTVDDIPLNDAPSHYEYLSNECFRKLIVGHRVTSPMLLGVRDGNDGLGNNADEIETATLLFDNVVIKCYQDEIIDCMDEILAINDISLELYFKTLKPLSFNDLDQLEGVDEDVAEEETGVELAKQPELTQEQGEILLEHLKGEVMSEEWEEVDSREYCEENVSNEEWASASIVEKKSMFTKLKDEIFADPNGFSYLDSKNYKIRYKYFKKSQKPNIIGNKSRTFCDNMMKLSDKNVVYRLEDIDRASRDGVNKQLGHDGKPYDLFKFKGGVYCRHAWKQVLYRLRTNTEPSKELKDYIKTGTIPKTYQKNPWGTRESQIAPIDMPNEGHYPGVK